ncbi:acetamidase/formamidase family protein [Sphingosinicella rhizophila]|uniref:Acetamidase/formamidase family protein n=1 Tax=Sphingosinicella rhizophila TaxID=3050082 RepID=A0ABU3Q8M4_9SPHN|nr:acetamidase/formamidase family protein [Sphingosinicella sp. GR2756]MDT9599756.1 acetamidase/formamidase family protein [Sphingosinicella sp. GR2756]
MKPVAGEGTVSSLVSGVSGGNMDVALFGPGASVRFPVQVPDAGFSNGGGHALQGDGKMAGRRLKLRFRSSLKPNDM